MDTKYFPIIRKALESSFPKTSSCGKTYQNELEFLKDTVPCPKGNALDYRSLQTIWFSVRNCKCHESTMVLELFGKLQPIEMDAFLNELDEEAKREKTSTSQVLSQFNADYITWRLSQK
jgi:hypothetical protein